MPRKVYGEGTHLLCILNDNAVVLALDLGPGLLHRLLRLLPRLGRLDATWHHEVVTSEGLEAQAQVGGALRVFLNIIRVGVLVDDEVVHLSDGRVKGAKVREGQGRSGKVSEGQRRRRSVGRSEEIAWGDSVGRSWEIVGDPPTSSTIIIVCPSTASNLPSSILRRKS